MRKQQAAADTEGYRTVVQCGRGAGGRAASRTLTGKPPSTFSISTFSPTKASRRKA